MLLWPRRRQLHKLRHEFFQYYYNFVESVTVGCKMFFFRCRVLYPISIWRTSRPTSFHGNSIGFKSGLWEDRFPFFFKFDSFGKDGSFILWETLLKLYPVVVLRGLLAIYFSFFISRKLSLWRRETLVPFSDRSRRRHRDFPFPTTSFVGDGAFTSRDVIFCGLSRFWSSPVGGRSVGLAK